MDKTSKRPWHTEPPPRPGWYEADFGDDDPEVFWLVPTDDDSIAWAENEHDEPEDILMTSLIGEFKWRAIDTDQLLYDINLEIEHHKKTMGRLLALVPDSFRSLRNDCYLTQKQVAEAAGVSVPMISQIENGSGLPGLDTLGRIAEVLNKEESDEG